MKKFDYRIFKEVEVTLDNTGKDGNIVNSKEDVFTIRQVGYDEKGILANYSEEPYWPIGNTISELKQNIVQMKGAFNKAVLTEEDFI